MTIDLRSDTVTKPTPAMRRAMAEAEVGDDVYGEDPTVNRLEQRAAEISGKEAALFVPTGTVANLVALMSHTTRGDQVVLETSCHILCCEEWAIGYICGVVPRAVTGAMGVMSADDVRAAITEEKLRHRARTSLVCLENTHNMAGGTIVAPDETAQLCAIAHELGVPVHLDGARIFNACAASNLDLQAFTSDVDSVMISLNKGLSGPGGAVLSGTQSFIDRSRVNLKRVGAWSISKAGIWAAAGLIALRDMRQRLVEDNQIARRMAVELDALEGLSVDLSAVQTNIVMVAVDPSITTGALLLEELKHAGIRGHLADPQTIRLVTHRHIVEADVERVAAAFRDLLGRGLTRRPAARED